MGNIRKDKPEGYFYFKSTGDGCGVIQLQYFIDVSLRRNASCSRD